MAQQRWVLSRGRMLHAMPKHLLWAVVSGAVVGMLLYWLKDVEALPAWALFIIMGTLWSNAAVAPVALPGRYWSFSFVGAMMLFLALVAGMILAPRFPFPQSPALLLRPPWPTYVLEANIMTWTAVLSGGCLGLLYGLLAGRTASMTVGLALGGASGYILGTLSLSAFKALTPDVVWSEWYGWRFNGVLHFAWQGALAMGLLHLGACLGAAMGAGPLQGRGAPATESAANRKSEIENREPERP